jgi:hypothetical protein
MNFRIAFSFSKTERKLRFRFWKWDIYCLDLKPDKGTDAAGNFEKVLNKAGSLSLKKDGDEAEKKENAKTEFGKLFIQALFYPDVEKKIFAICKKIIGWALNLFSVKFENLEIRGTLGDPFSDSVAMGISGGSYIPDWENENADWSAKGDAVFRAGFFKLMLFVFRVSYKNIAILFILWRGIRLAKKNPSGENLSPLRKWIFLKATEEM